MSSSCVFGLNCKRRVGLILRYAARATILDGSKSPREIASAARYLASTREMDSHTAERFADWLWLGSVVSPKI